MKQTHAFRTALIIALGSTLLLAACGTPLAPTPVGAQERVAYAPQHNNIAATFAGHPEGPVIYLCDTQLRLVTNPTGTAQMEEDHYLQYTRCPEVLIP